MAYTHNSKNEELFNLFYDSGIDMGKASAILNRCTNISHLDDVCAIIHLDNDNDHSYKFVVDPNSGRILDSNLQSLVKRGITHQFNCRNIDGVQRINSPYFYTGIVGLIGPLNYVHGENLKNIGITDDIPKRFKQFQKLEGTLNEMHCKGVLHRDVKSGNIIESENEDVSFIDFSISSSFSEDLGDRYEGWILGTPRYLHTDSKKSQDFYALGVSLLESIMPNADIPIFPNTKQVREFEKCNSDQLKKLYGEDISDYFLHLINQPPEYDTRIYYKYWENNQKLSLKSTVAMPSRMLDKLDEEAFSNGPTLVENEEPSIFETSGESFNCSLLKF